MHSIQRFGTEARDPNRFSRNVVSIRTTFAVADSAVACADRNRSFSAGGDPGTERSHPPYESARSAKFVRFRHFRETLRQLGEIPTPRVRSDTTTRQKLFVTKLLHSLSRRYTVIAR